MYTIEKRTQNGNNIVVENAAEKIIVDTASALEEAVGKLANA